MRVTFVGVGEAFDEALPNTSLFVAGMTGESRRTVLLDCGFTAAAAFFGCPGLSEADCREGPDALWISHYHGDHFFGLPFLLARLQEQGRARPLFIHGGGDVAAMVAAVTDLAYPNLREKLDFELVCLEARPGVPFAMAGFAARAALTGHGAPCLGLRLETRFGALYYGGDGAPTPAGRDLASGCALVVQEAYGLEAGVPGHGSVAEALETAEAAWAGALAVVHVRRELRRERGEDIRRTLSGASIRAFLPEPGDVFEV
ncbi:MBL fold metallo-hydrolase [Solidesulfovibrio sp.]